jgi:hypothetical protein
LRQVRRAVSDDLASLADDARVLEPRVVAPGASSAAAEAYASALECYERAELACDGARSPEELEPATAAVAAGSYELARAAALLDGHESPERRPPCFFDPRHGPSSREVEWSPDRASPRTVAACEADALRVEEGGEPDARHVLVGGRPVAHWDAPPAFDPWRRGHYGPAAARAEPGIGGAARASSSSA